MTKSCVMTPKITVGDREVESELFKELVKYTHSRESSKYIWGLLQVPEFVDSIKDQLEFTELREPTLASLKTALDLNQILNDQALLSEKEVEIKAINAEGNTIFYKQSSEVINQVLLFNEENPNFTALISKTSQGYMIKVDNRDIPNTEEANEQAFSNEVNNKLRSFINKLGFDVDFSKELPRGFQGMFNPLGGKETAEGLKTVIQVVKGEKGEEAFSEEFSHLIIEGLHAHPLVSRVLDSLSNTDTIKAVLGETFENYNQVYDGNLLKLKKEAAAALLQRHILGQQEITVQPKLISRLWGIAKRLFGQATTEDIESIIKKANADFTILTPQIFDESIIPIIDKAAILNAEALYSAKKEVSSLGKLVERGLEVASKRLKIEQMRDKEGEVSEDAINSIKNLQDLIAKKEYTKSALAFLEDAWGNMENINIELKSVAGLDLKTITDATKMRAVSSSLRRIKEFSDGYAKIIRDMQDMAILQELGEVDMTQEDATLIATKASELSTQLVHVKKVYDKQRFNATYNLLKPLWGEDKIIDVGAHKGAKITLEGLLTRADKDINGVDRWISSLSDASDPILSTLDKVVKVAKAKRDSTLELVLHGARTAHNKLTAAGHTSDFMYERDENNKLTGRIISDINYGQYYRDLTLFKKELAKTGLNFFEMKSKVEAWERQHSEAIVIDIDSRRKEIFPAASIYGVDRLSKLSPAQREYYDDMISSKAALEAFMPANYRDTHRAIQINNTLTEGIMDNITNPKVAARMALASIEDTFVMRQDETDFGEALLDDEKKVFLDLAGKPMEKIPIHFTHTLEDMSRLSTDFTGSMIAYAGMAINYNEMNLIVDRLELARDLIKEREVAQSSGEGKLTDSFKAVNKVFKSAYTKPGVETSIGNRIDDYYAAQVYGKTKRSAGIVKVLGKEISTTKLVDNVKHYTRAVGLAVNLFSGLGNVMTGKLQGVIEAASGEYFNFKNAAVAKANYYKLLPTTMGELNSTQKTGKLDLLINKFDPLQDFYESTARESHYKNLMYRVFGNSNFYFMTTMGEHYLQTRTMLAMLDAYKVKDSRGKQMSLFDAYEVAREVVDGKKAGGVLTLKEGITNLDGSAITNDELVDTKLRIGKVNQSMHGSFSPEDKGAIHRFALGGLAAQYRQWMPSHYYRRFSNTRYDAQLDQYREGYYRTVGRFMLETVRDARSANFKLATNWDKLNTHEKANVKRALTELTVFAMLTVLISAIGSAKDKKGKWAARMAIYQLQRLKLEVGASAPVTPSFLENAQTLLQSPAAAIKTVGNIADLFAFQDLGIEVESGRYKGWSRYTKNIVINLPIIGQGRKIQDLSNEDYMFNIFK